MWAFGGCISFLAERLSCNTDPGHFWHDCQDWRWTEPAVKFDFTYTRSASLENVKWHERGLFHRLRWWVHTLLNRATFVLTPGCDILWKRVIQHFMFFLFFLFSLFFFFFLFLLFCSVMRRSFDQEVRGRLKNITGSRALRRFFPRFCVDYDIFCFSL